MLLNVETYYDWCRQFNCDHAHCPLDCEHPQPFIITSGVLICGKCYFVHSRITEMVPCGPGIC